MAQSISLTDDISTRKAFSTAITEFGLKDKRVFTVAADSESRFGAFVKEAPERAINVGIAEQNAMSIAAGLAFCGKIPFVSTYATFLTMRAFEQIRTDIAFANLNVRIVGTNVGASSDWLGFTHQAFEDISIMRTLPNMTVLVPADGAETYYLVKALLDHEGPAYLRIRSTGSEPHIPGNDTIEIGKARLLREGNDITIAACGRMVHEALMAADKLAQDGVKARVLGIHTIKPLDEDAVLRAARETGKIITVEEHSIIGGLGSAVSELVSENLPCLVRRMGVRDRFGVPGSEEDLFEFFGLTAEHIANETRDLLKIEGD
ncbi:MAG: transketolase C-terminal domain-containing protein [Bacillota bacterium]|nr:transketolase C-terminal domain-containing protein [Bacillota bacterium]HOB89587.1 transketolase C-terminal domain-containing protein [Bacillota bacterium]HPZ92404.1 transketolase C-terminal domain-containing protein [Bacillota bacterium]HQE04504.1 transketolase C-terminal domain-containing protein [Bacillota bacterium]